MLDEWVRDRSLNKRIKMKTKGEEKERWQKLKLPKGILLKK